MASYESFLATKTKLSGKSGFSVETEELNEALFDWQQLVVQWALWKGKCALFEDCGLGKTLQQLVWAQMVAERTEKPVIILAPLAVSTQTIAEGKKFGINVVRYQLDFDPYAYSQETGLHWHGIFITNYEQLHHVSGDFGGIVLDESSILKSYSGSTRQAITEFAKPIPYRLAATATPAPNDLIEIINHAEFLGIMEGKEIIALYFTQDGNTTHKWRLKGHAQKDFYKWLSSWAVALRKPSDLGLGFTDGNYWLPEIAYHQHVIKSNAASDELFAVEAQGLLERRKARKKSLPERVQQCADLVNAGIEESWIVWCDLNDESALLTKLIPGAVEVRGSDKPEHKEKAMMDFATGKIRVLVTKPTIAGFGMNWQHCCRVAFVGLSDSFEQFYQAVRRCWRFGQQNKVMVHIFTSEAEGGVLKNIQRKQDQASKMMDELVKQMEEFNQGSSSVERENMVYDQEVAGGKNWKLLLGDAIERIDEIADNSVGLSVFSPPFPGMYAYTNSPRDMGNTTGINEMVEHFRFLIGQDKLYRVMMPGRMVCIHLMQLTAMKNRDGYIGIKDYRGRVIEMMIEAGFVYAGEVTIDKNPQVQATRNKERGLLFKTLATDSSLMRMAMADYLIYFRKPGQNPSPIQAGQSQKYNKGGGWITEEEWIEWAAPVWYRQVKGGITGLRELMPEAFELPSDFLRFEGYPGQLQTTPGISETDVLNVAQARDTNDERHLCPLQLGVIERAIKLWSAPGDLVFSPFAGVGSEGYQALKLNRRFVGIELKASYWRSAQRNLRSAVVQSSQLSLL